jgi:hypothetical protein
VLDPGVRLLGLQIAPDIPEANLLIFEHRCGSTISVLARALRPFLDGEDRHAKNFFGTEQCNQHCRILENLSACDNRCVNARDRAMVQKILELRGVGR